MTATETTPKPIKQLLQEVFDKVTKHLLTQNEKSLSSSGHCAYRGNHNRMCAIGALIPDDKYASFIEDKNVASPTVKMIIFDVFGMYKYDVYARRDFLDSLVQLQKIHDSWDVGEWRDKLTEFAKHRELKFNEQ